MSENKLENALIESLKEIAEQYNDQESAFLTENDVVCKLFSILEKKLNRFTNIQIHTEIRPFHGNEKDCNVIRGGAWKKQGKVANVGEKIDIGIIESNNSYYERALAKAKIDQGTDDLNYWRILSYPVEALKAAIEVKIRVKNNSDGIKRDIEKLKKLNHIDPNNPNNDCLLFFLVLDRQAKESRLSQIKKKCPKEIHFFTANGKA
jgi:hypothetical protein